MGRPAGWQWQPLGLDSDPVPGDPGRISQEAQHLASVASQITDQVAMLRAIAASNDDEVGKHADRIRSAAAQVASKLDEVVGRYQKVSSALSGWIPELEQAQAMSIQALDQAEGPYRQLHQAVALPSGDHLTAQQKQQVADYQNAMNRAQGALDAAVALLNRATSLRDSEASRCAGLINQACDDAVKDSWWDDFVDFVSEWSWLIKDICTGLEIAATILAVLALIFTGVGWLVILGVVLTSVALAGRIMLALTGNGSLFDVMMDLVALASFGMSSGGTWVIGKLTGTMVDLSKGIETAKAADLLDEFGEFAGDAAKQRVLAKFLAKVVPVVDKEATTTFMERVLSGGDSKTVNLMKAVSEISEKFGDSPAIKAIAEQAKLLQNIMRGYSAFANTATVFSLAGGGIEFDGPNGPTAVNWHIPGIGNWYQHNIEDRTTTKGGFRWALSSL